MTKRITLAILTIIGLILITDAAAYAEQKNLAGNWTFRVNDEMTLRLVLTQKGKNIDVEDRNSRSEAGMRASSSRHP